MGRPRKKPLPIGTDSGGKQNTTKPITTGRKRGRPPKNKSLLNEVQNQSVSRENTQQEKSMPDVGEDTKASVLRRPNKLNALLSSSQKQEPKSKSASLKSGSKPNHNAKAKSFEEDDGFLYQRSQDKSSKGRSSQASSLISKLKEETEGLINDQQSFKSNKLHLDNRGTKRRHLNPSSKDITTQDRNGASSKSSTPHPLQSRLQLSSPIKSPISGNEAFLANSSDEYREETSHHTLQLTDVNPPKDTETRSSNKRRTSYYNRGKRVSSIGNGYVGVPHSEVSSSDFYKLLDNSLPEPHRMRQLLIWCLRRNLENEEIDNKALQESRSPEDQTVINIAKVIKEEILQDLISGDISTSWYDQSEPKEDTVLNSLSHRDALPNPVNISNEENMHIFKKKLNGIIQEKEDWLLSYEEHVKPITNLRIVKDISTDSLRSYCQTKSPESLASGLKSVLDAPVEEIQEKTRIITKDFGKKLEDSVDKLYHASYQISQIHKLINSKIHNFFSSKVSALVKKYIHRSMNLDGRVNTFWPVPKRTITIKELLRGISRLEEKEIDKAIPLEKS